ncbi:uncharacterized protein BX663DRAFT_585936, partial [Cokeromyces recurvatus]|uniref:uncharacterized protein n=1 Tax=Cokeromyces recurvatus TaxID=90255 RepID=UPI002220A6C8
VNPSCPLPAFEVPLPGNQFALGIQLGRHLRLICLYLPPDQPTMRCSDVSSVLSSLPLSHDTIICGDLNARLGDITGDSGSNSRGATVLDWCMDNNLSILNRHLSFGVPTLVDFRRGRPVSSIVDYFITNLVPYDASLPSASLTVASDLSLGSDHKLMSLSFEYCPPQASVVHPSPTTSSASLSSFRRCWNLSRLKEPDVCDLFYHKFASLAFSLVQDLRALVSSPPRSRPDIDAINQRLNDAIYTALDQSVGARAQRPAHWKKFWTPDLQEAADRRERYYRRWKHSRSAMDKIYWWNMHVEAHAKFKQDLRRAKQVSWRAFCDSLEKDDFGTVVLPKVKRIKSRRQRQSGFVHPDGDSAGAIALRDHLASVYSGSSLPSVRPPTLEVSPDSLPFSVSLPSCGNSGSSPGDLMAIDDDGFSEVIRVDNIISHIKCLPRRKAPGSDHLRAEMLIPIKKPLAKVLSPLFALCYQWSYT